jgi:imidazolonepropionase-like amidohydrolase
MSSALLTASDGSIFTPPVWLWDFDTQASEPIAARLELRDGHIVRRVPCADVPELWATAGLINCHLHWLMLSGTSFVPLMEALRERPEEVLEVALHNARRSARVGITAGCDKGSPTDTNAPLLQRLEAAWRSGEPLPHTPWAPMMLVRPDSFAGGWCVQIHDEADIERRARETRANGASLLKIIPEADWQPTAPHYPLTFTPAAVLRAGIVARELGLSLAVHAKGAHSIRLAIEAGAHCIEHGLEATLEDLRAMQQAGIYYCPTLHGFACRLRWAEKNGQRLVMARQEWERAVSVVRQALDLGSGQSYDFLLFGSDAGSFDTPHASLEELYHLRAAGWSPRAVFRAATVNGAAYMGRSGELGSLRDGARADVVFWDNDPLSLPLEQWLELESRVVGVVLGGKEVPR